MKKFFDTDPDHYSKYTLRWLAAVANILSWGVVWVVTSALTVAICMIIEWWTA
ncbi:hypothetical protein [Klebsiella pneumoniae]|uniref:hypothetical protein n=1 Tax=Klebsiella pneumoniae TaxID=573 RepID=UPI001CDAC945|nr:hypothetical protein [Klebsiella pneumoniae]